MRPKAQKGAAFYQPWDGDSPQSLQTQPLYLLGWPTSAAPVDGGSGSRTLLWRRRSSLSGAPYICIVPAAAHDINASNAAITTSDAIVTLTAARPGPPRYPSTHDVISSCHPWVWKPRRPCSHPRSTSHGSLTSPEQVAGPWRARLKSKCAPSGTSGAQDTYTGDRQSRTSDRPQPKPACTAGAAKCSGLGGRMVSPTAAGESQSAMHPQDDK